MGVRECERGRGERKVELFLAEDFVTDEGGVRERGRGVRERKRVIERGRRGKYR